MLRACFGQPPRLEKMSHALGFSLALLIVSLPMACVGSAILQAVHLLQPSGFGRSVFHWWLGDTAGILSLLPVLLINVAPLFGAAPAPARPRQRSRREWLVILGETAALVGSLLLIYLCPPIRESHVPYLSFVPLTWIALRHGLPGAALAIFGVNVGSVFVLKLTHAPESVLVSYLLFDFATTAMGLALGAMVTRREHAEIEKKRLLEILEATPDFVTSLALDGSVLYANTAIRELNGDRTRDGDATLRTLYPPWAAKAVLEQGIPAALRTGRWSSESALIDARGREVPVSQVIVPHRESFGSPTAVFTVARDITDQKKAEALRLESERKMLAAQKLESLGVLAGGVAHDFNNLLTTMLGNANLARLGLPDESPAHRNLQQIEHAALRAAELCQQMLAYSGKGQFEIKRVDLSSLVSDTAHLLQVSIPKKATLRFELSPTLPPVRADATQLRQIVMNLVLNAADAIGERAGCIHVATGMMHADEAWLREGNVMPPPPAGNYVYVEVTDDGRGMSAETKARIFEPFFTTKFTGHGLGLPAVLGIVRSHGGTLRVHSEPEQGARFRVLLPAADGEAARATSASTPPHLWRGSGHILVVDDEETVRIVTARVLEGAGFTVELAADGSEAVRRFTAQPAAYRAVVLDLLMPVLDGEHVLAEMRRQRADLPALLMSGYSGRGGIAGSERAPTVFLPKPFQRETLLRTLHGLLESSPHGHTNGHAIAR
jgi:PAS domain S-box-containing protein